MKDLLFLKYLIVDSSMSNSDCYYYYCYLILQLLHLLGHLQQINQRLNHSILLATIVLAIVKIAMMVSSWRTLVKSIPVA